MQTLIIRLLGLFLILTSCAGNETFKKRTSLEGVYMSNGVERYFLTSLPDWANFSSIGGCYRKTAIKYLSFDNLKKSYGLNYEQMISLQHIFNRKIQAYKISSNQIPLKDEAFIFYNSYEQVVGGSRDFVPPKYQKISLIWIDPYLNRKKGGLELKALFKNKKVLDGHPILMSSCLSSFELEEFSQKLELESYGVKYISAEMFSTFDRSGTKKPFFGIELSEILKDKKIKFFGKEKPKEFIGIQ